MDKLQQLKDWAEMQKAQRHFQTTIGDLQVQVYEHSPLQFNVRTSLQQEACLKLEERTPGRFTIAASPQIGKSIDYTNAKVFPMGVPLESIRQAFPYEYIKHIVKTLLAH